MLSLSICGFTKLPLLEGELPIPSLEERFKLMTYCDDVNLMVNKLEEFKMIDEAFTKFEDMSGAILSRNQKSKVLGLGAWTGKADWPLAWLKTVLEVKVLGFKICASYKDMMSLNKGVQI